MTDWSSVLRDGFEAATDDEIVQLGEWTYLTVVLDEICCQAWDVSAELIEPPAIESQAFWRDWDWPEDVAAEQLAEWRSQIDGITA